MFRYYSKGDYLARKSLHRERQRDRELEFRSLPRVIVKTEQAGQPYGWSTIYAIHPNNEKAPTLPDYFRWSVISKSWFCLARTDKVELVVNKVHKIFNIS